ncbi:hypothetical protein [Streptobacillus notomytis]|uniref:hypothetical protein n=1 Tax=Streptobacillus notomytis TaxID=1712031 RepID=UPI0009373614|nr:hypothetical protein [Streptobacillus notomytis]
MKRLLLMITLLIGLITFPAKLSGPRYRLEGAISAFPYPSNSTNGVLKIEPFIYQAIAFLPEWKSEISKIFDVTFGPKLTVILSEQIFESKFEIFPNATLSMETDLNFRVKENVKIYLGMEAGLGVGVSFSYKKNGGSSNKSSSSQSISYNTSEVIPAIMFKGSIGAKLKDKYNVALYGGILGKGFLGVEFGYTFE